MNDKTIDTIRAALSTIRSTGRKPTAIRMHPLDIQWARRHYLKTDTPELEGSRLLDLPLIPDCAVARGKPQPDYSFMA